MNKKKFDKVGFTIEILSNSENKDPCYFCKYRTENYSEITKEFLIHCGEKCSKCEGRYKNRKGNLPSYIRNEYKPLFNWEESDE